MCDVNYNIFIPILGKLYEDEDFPACHTSVDADETYVLESDCKWLRPKVSKVE